MTTVRTLSGATPTRQRTGRFSLSPAPDGPPADYAGPAADQNDEVLETSEDIDTDEQRWREAAQAVSEEDREAELERLAAEQAADAATDDPSPGETLRDKVVMESGLYESPVWETSATGDPKTYAKAPKLTELAQELIENKKSLKHLKNFKILVLWKDKGGTVAGEPRIAHSIVMGGLGRYFGEAHFLIWFAADNCKEMRLQPESYRAAMFHELLHCWHTVNDDGTEKPKRRNGIEVFPEELAEFGLWRTDLQKVSDALAQKPLWEPTDQMAEGVV